MEKLCKNFKEDSICHVQSNSTTTFHCPYKKQDISFSIYGTYIITNGWGNAFWDYACKYWEPTDEIYLNKKHNFKDTVEATRAANIIKDPYSVISSQPTNSPKEIKKSILSWDSEEHKNIQKEIHYKEQFLYCCRNCDNRDIDTNGEIYCNKIFGVFGEKKFSVLWNGTCDYHIIGED